MSVSSDVQQLRGENDTLRSKLNKANQQIILLAAVLRIINEDLNIKNEHLQELYSNLQKNPIWHECLATVELDANSNANNGPSTQNSAEHIDLNHSSINHAPPITSIAHLQPSIIALSQPDILSQLVRSKSLTALMSASSPANKSNTTTHQQSMNSNTPMIIDAEYLEPVNTNTKRLLNEMAIELQLSLCLYLTFDDLGIFMCVSKYWLDIVSDEIIWKHAFFRQWPMIADVYQHQSLLSSSENDSGDDNNHHTHHHHFNNSDVHLSSLSDGDDIDYDDEEKEAMMNECNSNVADVKVFRRFHKSLLPSAISSHSQRKLQKRRAKRKQQREHRRRRKQQKLLLLELQAKQKLKEEEEEEEEEDEPDIEHAQTLQQNEDNNNHHNSHTTAILSLSSESGIQSPLKSDSLSNSREFVSPSNLQLIESKANVNPNASTNASKKVRSTKKKKKYETWKQRFVERTHVQRCWRQGRTKVMALIGHKGSITDLKFDEYRLVTAGDDGVLIQWRLNNMKKWKPKSKSKSKLRSKSSMKRRRNKQRKLLLQQKLKHMANKNNRLAIMEDEELDDADDNDNQNENAMNEAEQERQRHEDERGNYENHNDGSTLVPVQTYGHSIDNNNNSVNAHLHTLFDYQPPQIRFATDVNINHHNNSRNGFKKNGKMDEYDSDSLSSSFSTSVSQSASINSVSTNISLEASTISISASNASNAQNLKTVLPNGHNNNNNNSNKKKKKNSNNNNNNSSSGKSGENSGQSKYLNYNQAKLDAWRNSFFSTFSGSSFLRSSNKASTRNAADVDRNRVFNQYSKFDHRNLLIQNHHKQSKLNFKRISFAGHGGPVFALDFNHESLVSGSYDKCIKIWSLMNGSCTATLRGHGEWVSGVKLHHRHILSCSWDASIRFWKLDNDKSRGTCITKLQSTAGNAIYCVEWSYDRQFVIGGCRHKAVQIWDLEHSRLIRTFMGHLKEVYCCQMNQNIIVSGSADRSIKIWDPRSAACLASIEEAHAGPVMKLQFDDHKLISAGYDKQVRIYDLRTRKQLHSLSGHSKVIFALQYDQQKIITGGADQRVLVWNFE